MSSIRGTCIYKNTREVEELKAKLRETEECRRESEQNYLDVVREKLMYKKQLAEIQDKYDRGVQLAKDITERNEKTIEDLRGRLESKPERAPPPEAKKIRRKELRPWLRKKYGPDWWKEDKVSRQAEARLALP